jgi:hypothetical protein
MGSSYNNDFDGLVKSSPIRFFFFVKIEEVTPRSKD